MIQVTLIKARIKELKNYFIINNIRGKSYSESLGSLLGYIFNRMVRNNNEPLNKGNVIEGYQIYTRPLLVSYSRSGTNWVRYIIEYLSQQPTPGYQRSEAGVNFVIDRAHAGYKNIHLYNKVILVIRNYKECLVRHHGIEFVKSFPDISKYLETDGDYQSPDWYIKNIEAFDGFKGEKMVLYYEDLLTNSEEQVKRIAGFLGFDNMRLNNLISNIDEHKIKSVALYKNDHDSVTAGDVGKLDYHSKQGLSKEECIAFDDYYRKNYSDLFDLYLSRYQE